MIRGLWSHGSAVSHRCECRAILLEVVAENARQRWKTLYPLVCHHGQERCLIPRCMASRTAAEYARPSLVCHPRGVKETFGYRTCCRERLAETKHTLPPGVPARCRSRKRWLELAAENARWRQSTLYPLFSQGSFRIRIRFVRSGVRRSGFYSVSRKIRSFIPSTERIFGTVKFLSPAAASTKKLRWRQYNWGPRYRSGDRVSPPVLGIAHVMRRAILARQRCHG